MDSRTGPFVAAITGGFGDYNGAEGRVDTTFLSVGQSRFTMTIETP
jgi:hypothetical protein